MKVDVASRRALVAAEKIAPLVRCVEVVGSVRRRKPEVGDIELLVEPCIVEADLFGTPGPDLEPLRGLLSRWGRVTKDGDRYIQVVSGRTPAERIQWDVFLCHPPAQWGALKVIRTGPREFSIRCVMGLRQRGYLCRDGAAYRAARARHADGSFCEAGDLVPSGDVIPTPTEREFLDLCGVEWLPPEERS